MVEENNHEFILKHSITLKTIRATEEYMKLVIANNLELFFIGMEKVTDMV